jgi:hypothetical protein
MKQYKNLISIHEKKGSPNDTWGNWSFCINTYRLTYWHHDIIVYPIDLTTKDTNSKLLDLIFQVGKKPWAYRAMADLIDALNEVFDPQVFCCSRGENKKFDATELCKRHAHRLIEYSSNVF